MVNINSTTATFKVTLQRLTNYKSCSLTRTMKTDFSNELFFCVSAFLSGRVQMHRIQNVLTIRVL